MYLSPFEPIPVQPEPHGVDWAELVGTWTIVGLLGLSVYFEFMQYKHLSQRSVPFMGREE